MLIRKREEMALISNDVQFMQLKEFIGDCYIRSVEKKGVNCGPMRVESRCVWCTFGSIVLISSCCGQVANCRIVATDAQQLLIGNSSGGVFSVEPQHNSLTVKLPKQRHRINAFPFPLLECCCRETDSPVLLGCSSTVNRKNY